MTRTEEYLARKCADVKAMAGKRGVTAARAKLEDLRAAHSRMAGQTTVSPYTPPRQRSAWEIQHTRDEIDRLATWQPHRGGYGEIASTPRVPERLAQHPTIREIATLDAHLSAARTVLPGPYQDWDGKGRGNGVAVDLYGYADGGRVSVWQIRKSSRGSAGHYLSVSKTYRLVTIGDEGPAAREVPPHKIKRAAAADPAPDSPIRALNGELKLPAPGGAEWTAYKLVGITEDGRYVSLYDGETEYKLGKRLMEAAQPDHGGGYYVSRTPEEARSHGAGVNRAANMLNRPTALLECRCIGRGIQYDTKVAVGVLTPTRTLD